MDSDIPRPAGVLVDVGGTLLREVSYDIDAGIRALNPFGNTEGIIAELKTAIAEVYKISFAEFNLAAWISERRERFQCRGSIDDLEFAVWSRTVSLEPMPGVKEGLQVLSDRGLAVGCISNAIFSGQVLQGELEQQGLADSIRFLISSADVAVRKPSREIFSAGVSRLGLEPSDIWFVGDTWTADIQGASAAGLFPVWLSITEQSPEGVHHSRVASWKELTRLIIDASD